MVEQNAVNIKKQRKGKVIVKRKLIVKRKELERLVSGNLGILIQNKINRDVLWNDDVSFFRDAYAA